jgi:hypothetical protein
MQTELSREKNLRLILREVQAAGLDRVRVFQFKEETRSFIFLDALGMKESKNLQGYTVSLDGNPYARHTEKTARSSPKARKYDCTMFGPDPEAAGLEKDPDLPWVVVPLVVADKLYGQIVADNTPTRREITEEGLEYITLLGVLAAQTIANAETIELRTRKTKELFLENAFHNLKTPIHSIAGIVEQLITEEWSPQELQEWLCLLHEEAQRLSRLTERAGEFTRQQRSSRPRTQVSLKEIVRNRDFLSFCSEERCTYQDGFAGCELRCYCRWRWYI